LSDESEQNAARKRVRFFLIDRTGPLAEFESWEDAFQYMASNHVQGGSIVRSEEPIGERPMDGLEADRLRDSASAARATGWPAVSYAANPPGVMPAPEPAATKAAARVLVIEEDVSTLLTMAQMVKAAGHSVVLARDAAEGVEAVKMERPDLILVGLNQTAGTSGHGWKGFQVVEWLMCHYPLDRTKYIIVAGGDPEKLKLRAAAAGAFGVLSKPVKKELLLTELRRAIGGLPEMQQSEAPRPGPG